MKWKCVEFENGSNPYICKTESEFNRLKRKYGKRLQPLNGSFYIVKEPTYSKWQLIDYFDVWGNAKDGWDVNNMCVVGDEITISDYATDKEILNYLVTIGYLTTSDMRQIVIEDLCDFIEIYQRKSMKPLYSLRRILCTE
jgi:hypothetical protein